jgi:hypothetical protein
MEGRIKKLIEVIETGRNNEYCILAAYQLGEIALEYPLPILTELLDLTYRADDHVKHLASIAFSNAIHNSKLNCEPSHEFSQDLFNLNTSLEAITQTEPSDTHKKRKIDIVDYETFLNAIRCSLISADFNTSYSSALLAKEIMRHSRVCNTCIEDLQVRMLFLCIHDKTVDYSYDIPQYPLRDTSADALVYSCAFLNCDKVLNILITYALSYNNIQGPIITLTKFKLVSQQALDVAVKG